MTESKVTFANIVSTPTETSWSQAYTAGKLYAVLSLEGTESDPAHLAAVGKEIINALVEEFFTLETKDLTTIKTAVIQTTQKIPKDIDACLVVISLVNNILYAFSLGGGKVAIKRRDKIGIILQPNDDEVHVQAVSGFLENNDMIILQTKQFAESISPSDLESFATPAEAVEILSPKIHEKEIGGASAIVLSFVQEAEPEIVAVTETFQEEKEEEVPSALEDEVTHREPLKRSFAFPKLHLKLPKLAIKLPRKTLLLLLIPLILIGILAFSIYTTKQNQENAKVQQLFDTVYPQAQKKYDEGQALLSLNEQLAQDDFLAAKTILENNKSKFSSGSDQERQILELLDKVNAVVKEDATGSSLKATETDTANSPLLSALLKNKAIYVTAGDTTIYTGSNTSVQDATGKTIIANDDDWKTIGGLGAFGTNIYVLDKTGKQILKFLGGASDSKSVYASGDFEKATAMAIDSSIYVLNTDGSVKKFTRGTADTFGVTGLEVPLKSPTRIVTNADTENVYILDPGTARIVVLGKTGAFKTAYTATILKNAKDFDVQEEEKKIYILSGSKVFEINIP
ncbi:MAG: hypothetical protein KBD46_00455 [Candidatus Levybacteria bacterium]|nr:hypothetical protein [Candidatus Levybacteria bacterium]